MAPHVYARLGARIQALRKEHVLTQSELSEAADVGLSYIVKLEAGVRKARLEVLERLAKGMGEPMWRLFADQRMNPNEKRWQGDAAKLAEILPALAAENLKAVLAVAQQLAGRRRS